MKIEKSHLAVLTAHVKKFDRPDVRDAYRNGLFPRAELVKDLDRRYRWDLFWAMSKDGDGRELADRLWSYLGTDHIDTALRKIVAPLSEGE